MVDDEKERARRCPNCNHIIYPKISPAVIVGIVNDKDQIVLTKYKDRPSVGYALVAGFCEIGETIEDTIKREVKEEVGLKVKDITYYKSQPWALSSSLLLGFFCRVDGSEEIYVDGIELKEANWFSKEDIPEFSDTSSLTAEMKRIFMKGNIPW
ncbi:MAG: NUDIX domain-containing protein [Solobacterium sp.]|nr:NUDIX domain-containing protein [Solobacterium sp.]